MGRYDFTEDDLQAQVSKGVHPANLKKCEARQNKAQTGDNIYWEWVIGPEDDDPKNVGKHVFAHTPVGEGKGGFIMNFLRGLGISWDEFNEGFNDGDPTNHLLQGVDMNVETSIEISPDQNGVTQKQVRVLKLYPTE